MVDVTSDPFRAVEAAARSRPDVVTVDLGLEGLGGRGADPPAVRLDTRHPRDRALRRLANAAAVADALGAGAAGYVLREDGPDALLAAVRAALTGAAVLSPVVATSFGSEVTRLVASERALAAELEEVRSSVTQGTSAKADFLANISHELRTPVTVAKGIAYVLRNPSVPEGERDQFLGQLQASLDKLMAHRRRDHHDRGARARHVRARDHPDRPRAADPARDRRGRARVPRHADRSPGARRAAARSPTVPGSAGWSASCSTTPAATRRRRSRDRARGPHARRGGRRRRHRPRRGPRSVDRDEGVRAALLDRRGDASQGEGGRRRRAASGAHRSSSSTAA